MLTLNIDTTCHFSEPFLFQRSLVKANAIMYFLHSMGVGDLLSLDIKAMLLLLDFQNIAIVSSKYPKLVNPDTPYSIFLK